MSSAEQPRAFGFAALLLPLIAVLVAVLPAAIGIPLTDPDEGRSGEVAREMVVSGNYLVPHLNALPYVDKPVVYFGSEAIAVRLFGASELPVRLPSVIAALLIVFLVGRFASRHLGGDAPLIAGLVAASAPLLVVLGRTAILDSVLALFVTIAMFSFYESTEADDARRARLLAIVAWAATGIGVLTKGPVALLLPLLVNLPYAIWRKRGRRMFPILGLAVFLLIVIPWIVIFTREVPDFLEYVFVTETFKRMTSNALRRTKPFWYIGASLLVGTLPWCVIPLASFRRLRETLRSELRPLVIFLLLWIVLPVVFFSLSKGKLPQYVLPLIPALALLIAAIARDTNELPGRRWAAAALLLLGGIVAGALLSPALARKAPAAMLAVARTPLSLFAAIAIASGLTAWFSRSRAIAAVALALPLTLATLTLRPVISMAANIRSERRLAQQIVAAAGPAIRVIGVSVYQPSLSFYLRQPILLSSDDGSQIRSNYVDSHYAPWLKRPGTTLRPDLWWRSQLAQCTAGTVFLTHDDQPATRAEIAGHLPLIGVSGDIAAYGPCR